MGPPNSIMKFLRVGETGKEIPAIIDGNEIIRDLSTVIDELNSSTLNDATIQLVKNTNLKKLKEIPNNIRIGECVSNPGKFIGIGLNQTDLYLIGGIGIGIFAFFRFFIWKGM